MNLFFFLAQKVLMVNATSAEIRITVFGRLRTHFRNAAMSGLLFMRIHKYTCCASVHLLQASVLYIHFHLCSTYCLAGVIEI